MTTFTIITRGTETAAELDAVMSATRVWWAQFEPDAPEFVVARNVARPRSERADEGGAA